MTQVRASGYSVRTVTIPRVRLSGYSVDGTLPTPKVRLAGYSVVAGVKPTAANFSNRTSEPEVSMTVTATAASGSVPVTGWSWVQVGGPSVPYSAVGAVLTLRTPSDFAGTLVQFAATPYANTTAGDPKTVDIYVLPQTDWIRIPGGEWMGTAPVVVL